MVPDPDSTGVGNSSSTRPVTSSTPATDFVRPTVTGSVGSIDIGGTSATGPVDFSTPVSLVVTRPPTYVTRPSTSTTRMPTPRVNTGRNSDSTSGRSTRTDGGWGSGRKSDGSYGPGGTGWVDGSRGRRRGGGRGGRRDQSIHEDPTTLPIKTRSETEEN